MPASKPHLVVMAGGSGTRFWPRSTSRRPKQLLAFGAPSAAGTRGTLLAQTLERFDGLVPDDRRIVVTTAALHDAIAREAPTVTVLAEPQGRNTAACIYWAARVVAERDPDGVMLVMSADHFVADVDAFRRTVREAIDRARDRAETFWRAGTHLWNSGMFVWRPAVVLAAFDRCMPDLRKLWEAGAGDVAAVYPTLPVVSIDYGVMEKAGNVVTFPLECGWEDVGSWASVDALGEALHARGAQDVRLVVDELKKRRPELV